MGIEVLAGAAFAGLFGLFVVVPTIIRKRHENNETE